jgi:hypothetical protein
LSTTALVEELDDVTLRCGHALLNHTRAEAFRRWIDEQLVGLEQRFESFSHGRVRRSSFGR